MHIFDNLRLGTKLGLLVFVTMVCVVGAAFAVANLIQHELLTSRLEELKAVTQTARSLAADLQQQVVAGELTHDDAVRAFSHRARSMTYDNGRGYVFAYSMDGTAIAVPNAAQIGMNQLDVPVNGRLVIREIRDAVQATGGDAVINYEFPRPGEAKPIPKVSVATSFAPWNVFLGTGAYVDDLDARLWTVIRMLASGMAGLLLLVGGLAGLIARRITRPLGLLQASMRQLSDGMLEIEIAGTARRDEVGGMAAAVLVLKENAVRSRALEREQADASVRRAAEDERVRLDAEAKAAAEAASLVVGSIGKGLEALAVGDLTFRLARALPGAYEKLGNNYNAAMDELSDLLRGIIVNTSGIDAGGRDISQAADDLSRRTENQAASLEQTAAALDQLTATVRQTAESAVHISLVVAKTKVDAVQSGDDVRKAVGAMGSIEQSSKQISQIIGVIDEIAFQTNLLALNAGVEAARAGDSGRGFAVVASEVRALAQRSAEAAKEIKALISTSVGQVAVGVQLVGEAEQSLGRIVSQVTEITGTVIGMAASAREQATGLHEVNTAINHMDQITQQNAAMVEESTAASHALAGETAELVRLTERFQVGTMPGVPAEVRPTRQRQAPKASKVAKARTASARSA